MGLTPTHQNFGEFVLGGIVESLGYFLVDGRVFGGKEPVDSPGFLAT